MMPNPVKVLEILHCVQDDKDVEDIGMPSSLLHLFGPHQNSRREFIIEKRCRAKGG